MQHNQGWHSDAFALTPPTVKRSGGASLEVIGDEVKTKLAVALINKMCSSSETGHARNLQAKKTIDGAHLEAGRKYSMTSARDTHVTARHTMPAATRN